jgi:hypothetical protein
MMGPGTGLLLSAPACLHQTMCRPCAVALWLPILRLPLVDHPLQGAESWPRASGKGQGLATRGSPLFWSGGAA